MGVVSESCEWLSTVDVQIIRGSRMQLGQSVALRNGRRLRCGRSAAVQMRGAAVHGAGPRRHHLRLQGNVGLVDEYIEC